MLVAVPVPVLMLQGSGTRPFFADRARYVADHVRDARTREADASRRSLSRASGTGRKPDVLRGWTLAPSRSWRR